jgi:hypothetical protein
MPHSLSTTTTTTTTTATDHSTLLIHFKDKGIREIHDYEYCNRTATTVQQQIRLQYAIMSTDNETTGTKTKMGYHECIIPISSNRI